MIKEWRKKWSWRRQLRQWRQDINKWRRFWRSYYEYKQLAPSHLQPTLNTLYPCLDDGTAQTQIEPIYFYQDAWAFESIVKKKPKSHLDVGSHHKFVALLSKVVPLTMVDIRPLSLTIDSIQFQQGSILDLPFEDKSVLSLSSLCVVEHIGLGRYGDLLDPYGTEKAIIELTRILAVGGNLYLSVPIDVKTHTYFNAHRAFSETYLFEQFETLKIRVIEARYIFGKRFTKQPESGFGVGCYNLQRF